MARVLAEGVQEEGKEKEGGGIGSVGVRIHVGKRGQKVEIKRSPSPKQLLFLIKIKIHYTYTLYIVTSWTTTFFGGTNNYI